MGSAAYIGRVGGLAVALGVGTALATGYGIASADGTDSATSSSTSTGKSTGSGSAGSGSAGSGSADSSSTGSRATGTVDTTKPETKTETETDSETEPESGTDDSEADESGDGSEDDPADDDASADPEDDTDVAPEDGTDADAQPEDDTDTDEAPEAPESAAPPTSPETPDSKPDQKSVARDVQTQAATKSTKAAATTAPTPTPVKATTKTVTTAANPADPADTLLTADKLAVFASPRALAAMTAAQISPPVRPVATAPPNPVTAVVKVVSKVLDWALSATPGSPTQPTLAWALLAFARREVDNLLTSLSPPSAAATGGVLVDTAGLAVVTAADPRPGFPAPGQQLSPSTSFVDWVTGNYPPNDTFNRFGIWGTDVGTMWDNGIPDDPNTPINEHQVLIAFGDTFGGPNMTGTWRLNTLFRSSDINLADGMTIPPGQWLNGNMFGGSPLWGEHYSRQIVLPERLPAGLPTGVTLIPTAGISVPTPGTQYGATQYVSFMSVKQWGAAGSWSTNYSAMAYSEDNGENWYIAPESVRMNSPVNGNNKFQQAALVRPGDGYVYAYGTPNGRQGQAYVSRVLEADILDTSKYEYYNKGNAGWLFGIGAVKAGWYSNNPAKASAIFGKETGACGVGKAGNQVSEMSIQYNETLGKYVVLHGDQFNNIVIRTADSPEGKWSKPTVLMGQQNGGIYAPMMHPWSPSTQGTGTDLYWNLSLWSEYNVMLMKTDLTKL